MCACMPAARLPYRVGSDKVTNTDYVVVILDAKI